MEVRRQQESHGETETKSERVIIWVRDEGGPHEPAIPPTADEYAECGRGLLTLASTAESWGWFGDPSGRTICAVFTDSLKNVRP